MPNESTSQLDDTSRFIFQRLLNRLPKRPELGGLLNSDLRKVEREFPDHADEIRRETQKGDGADYNELYQRLVKSQYKNHSDQLPAEEALRSRNFDDLKQRAPNLSDYSSKMIAWARRYASQEVLDHLYQLAVKEINTTELSAQNKKDKQLNYAAAFNQSVETITQLIKEGANANGISVHFEEHASTPLFEAARNGHLANVQALIPHSAPTINQTQGLNNEQTSFSCAVKCGHAKVAVELLAYGAQINHRENEWYYLICLINDITKTGHLPLIKKLIAYLRHNYEHLHRDQIVDDFLLLHIAAEHGHLHVIQHLIEKERANINWANINYGEQSGHTALYFALKGGHIKTIEYLEKQGAKVSYPPPVEKEHFSIALFTAVKYGYLDAIKFCIDKGADINYRMHDESVLFEAVRLNDMYLVEWLISKGATLEDELKEQLFLEAIKTKNPKMVEYFIKQLAVEQEFKRQRFLEVFKIKSKDIFNLLLAHAVDIKDHIEEFFDSAISVHQAITTSQIDPAVLEMIEDTYQKYVQGNDSTLTISSSLFLASILADDKPKIKNALECTRELQDIDQIKRNNMLFFALKHEKYEAFEAMMSAFSKAASPFEQATFLNLASCSLRAEHTKFCMVLTSLIDAGFDINYSNMTKSELPILFMAAHPVGIDKEILKFLLSKGASIEMNPKLYFKTPLVNYRHNRELDPVKNRLERVVRLQLDLYLEGVNRRDHSHYLNRFFGINFGYSAGQKKEVATILQNALNDKNFALIENLSHSQKRALRQGRLGKIYTDMQRLDMFNTNEPNSRAGATLPLS